MKNSVRLLAIFLGLLSATLAVAAQDAFDYECSSVILLQSKSVQKDMGITEQQRTAMNRFADAHRSKLKGYYQKLQNAKSAPDEKKLLTMFTELKRGVLGQLSAAQLRRLREISLQELSFSALADSKVAARVGITSEQQKSIRSVLQDGLTKANGVQRSAINKSTADLKNYKPKTTAEQGKLQAEADRRAEAAVESVAPQVNQIRDSTKQKVMALLTAKQKSAWQALLGRPFHFSG